MKLEARDPRNSTSICIASVIYAYGPRLCLRLDGSDNRNDFWSLVDSEDIHPYGWCEEQGEQLQPPLGFAKNASYYPAFLSKLLQESKHLMAPKSCFKPVPPSPERNMFEVGMKLEAIDRKNPQLIGPATVGEVKGDKIYIQFDGWRGAFDYWCRYDSRDIFPVGWCTLTNHILQPPGTKGNLARVRGSGSSKSQSVSPNVAIHVETQSQSMGIPSPGSARSSGSRRNSPAVSKVVALRPSSPSTVLTPISSGATVTAYINQTCCSGPLLNQTSIIRLPLHYGPAPTPKILKKVVQALVDGAINPLQVFNSLVTAPSDIIITASGGGNTMICTIPAITTVEGFSDYIANFLQSIESCVNLVTLQPLHQVCHKCSQWRGSSQTLKRAQSTVNSLSIPSKRGRGLRRTLSVPTRGRRKQATSLREHNPLSPPPPYSPQLESLAGISQQLNAETAVPANPLDWTSQEVIEFIRAEDPSLSKHAHLIQSHEIDGRAFLLMTSDIAIKYMEMKVGPALKLCSLIDKLRHSMRY
ncbi:polycomb protein SCMH1-like isoform X2 [Watersipora subatra]